MAGFRQFYKLILRRDRVKLPVQLLCVGGSLVLMVPLLRNIHSDDTELEMLHAMFGANPASLVLTGPMDAPTFGSLMTLETTIW